MNSDRHDEDHHQVMNNYREHDDQNIQQILAAAGIDGGQYNLHDLIANDGLNDEIKKLLADANLWTIK